VEDLTLQDTDDMQCEPSRLGMVAVKEQEANDDQLTLSHVIM
jgi:hypothetical protein